MYVYSVAGESQQQFLFLVLAGQSEYIIRKNAVSYSGPSGGWC